MNHKIKKCKYCKDYTIYTPNPDKIDICYKCGKEMHLIDEADKAYNWMNKMRYGVDMNGK